MGRQVEQARDRAREVATAVETPRRSAGPRRRAGRRRRPPLATAGPTRGSNGERDDMSSASSSPTRSASASAAASFMPSVIAVACTSKAPRKMPGNASTLLIWLGKSERPVATTRACRCATSGCTSGFGLARPKMIASGGHPGDVLLGHGAAGDADVDVGAVQHVGERAGAAEVVGGVAGERPLDRRQVAALGVEHALAVGDREVPDPASSRILATATPAAPAPEMTTRVDSGSRPVSRSALVSAASATTAVPCWSSWKTGMSSISLSRSSISKQRGRRDVLEVDPAEARRQPRDRLDDLLDVGGGQADRHGVDAAELLEQHRLALHHRHRGGRADVAEAEHGRAVGDDRRPCWAPTCSAGSATGRRRSPRRPGPRPGV